MSTAHRPAADRWNDRATVITEAASQGLGARWAVTAAEMGGQTRYAMLDPVSDAQVIRYRQAAAVATELETGQATLSSTQEHMLKASLSHYYPDLVIPASKRATVMAVALQTVMTHDEDEQRVTQAAAAFLGNRATAMPPVNTVMAAWNAVRGSMADRVDTRHYVRQARAVG
jgi:hypothetical protein